MNLEAFASNDEYLEAMSSVNALVMGHRSQKTEQVSDIYKDNVLQHHGSKEGHG